MSNKKIVFCGCGPMGEGILGGLLNNNVAKAKDVTVNELLEVRRTYIAETYGVAAVENASDALKAADLVLIAVNPAQMPKVAQTIRPLIKKACIVMSIACGVSLGALAGMLGDDKKILRVMPNTLIKSGNGYSAACVNPNIDEEDKKLITAVLNALGQTMYVTEDMFETFTAFCCTARSGCIRRSRRWSTQACTRAFRVWSRAIWSSRTCSAWRRCSTTPAHTPPSRSTT